MSKVKQVKKNSIVGDNLPKPMKIRKVVAAGKKRVVLDKVSEHVSLPENITQTKKQYVYTVGKRKTAIATIRLFDCGRGDIVINQKDYKNYFPLIKHQEMILSPLILCGKIGAVDLVVKVIGGGITGQVDSIKHGIAKGLTKLNPDLRKQLKSVGFLTRDARIKERKKYGLKGARRAPQWQKR